jgi:hypothetical protein
MTKLSIIAATAALAVASLAVPAFAAVKQPATAINSEVVGGVPYCAGGDNLTQSRVDDIAANLPGSGASLWNGCIRVFVTDQSGHDHMAFYDPDTLKLVDTI